MKRTARDKRDLPHPPPVERIELPEEHPWRRLALAVVLLAFGGAMLAFAVIQLLQPDSEWMTVEAQSSVGVSCAQEFAFLYRPGGTGSSPTAERRGVTSAYSQLCRQAFQVFHSREAFEGVTNLYAINRRPNEVLEIDGGLYGAFAAVAESGSRAIYLGPVYSRYEDLFFCEDDSQLVDFDPRLSPEVAREYAEIAAFANDPDAIAVELLGGNQIRLSVSETYLAYAQREGVTDFIDFGWMRNAFIADYLAQGLTAQGYTNGALTSYDGFVRNLDGSGAGYSMNLFDRRPEGLYPAAVIDYTGPMSIVSLRDYPMNDLDSLRFYELDSGQLRTPYLDPADGLCRSAIHDLTCMSREKGCGAILLEMLPVYIADAFHPEGLTRLAEEGIGSLYCQDRVVCRTGPVPEISQLYQENGVRYTVAPAG